MHDELAYEQKADYPSEDAEIIRAEKRLAEVGETLHFTLGELATRLERVLRPAEPMSEPDDKMLAQVQPATSPLTDFLYAQASRIESENSHVNDLLRRLAL